MPQMCPECSRDNYDVAQTCGYCRQPLRGLLGQNTLLASRYQVAQVLGCGGMGAVYLAYDQRIQGRQVAVKENLDTTPLAHSQFDAEVKVMAALRHPNLPGISDHFTGPNGRQYLVMDYIAGETLEDLVAQRGPLPEAGFSAADIGKQLEEENFLIPGRNSITVQRRIRGNQTRLWQIKSDFLTCDDCDSVTTG